MIRRNNLFGPAAILLAFLILVPLSHYAGAQIDATGKVAPGLVAQLTAAGPDDIVEAVVKIKAKPKLDAIRGRRAPVFTELRRSASETQRPLVSYLNSPDVSNKVEFIKQFWIDNLVYVKATKDVIAAIAARPDVEVVFENFTLTALPVEKRQSDPDLGSAEATAPLWDPLQHIGVKQVWSSYGFDGAGVRVGGLDTGVDISHPDLAGKMINNSPGDPTYPGGWAEFDGDGNIISGSVPHDSDQHGTHTTGTMIGGSASGYAVGCAPGANLIHGLVIPGGSGSFVQVAAGMEWIIDPDGNPATDDGAQVVNMSLGATGTYPAMIAPTDNMVAADVFPSFSIGNSGPGSNTTGSPGNVPSAFGVGATDSGDAIASFSSRGPVTWNDPPYVGTWIKPDISAPGVSIYSTVPGGGWEWNGWSGTSMAAPHIAGTVALMRQANPAINVDTIKLLLSQTALDLGNPGMDNDFGAGRVNAFEAVSAALSGVGTLQGTVYSSTGPPVDNALVLVTDTGQKVYTDALGNYTIQLVADDHTVQASRFGYETASALVSIVADAITVQDFTLNQLPSGTIAGTVTDATTGDGIAADISVLLGGEEVLSASTDPVTGAYSIVAPVGTYDVVFSPVFPYPTTLAASVEVTEAATTTVNQSLLAAQVLIVDDDGGGGFQTYYEQAVMAAGRSYLTIDTPPTAAQMALFESVVWLTGNDYTTTLSAADQAEIAAFLDAGGRLFISGQDIGYDIRTEAFYADYLHAQYVADDVGLGAVIGDAGNAVGSGFAFDIQGGDGANNQSYPSEIDPIAPAATAFTYDPLVPASSSTSNEMAKNTVSADGITSSGTAGLTYDDGNQKLVYFSFGFEAIADGTTRGMLMGRILDWLQGYPNIDHTPLGETEDTENPYAVVATITAGYLPLDMSSFMMYYDTGGSETGVAMTPTGNPDEYVAYIPAQPLDTQVNYYISASDVGGHVSTHPMGAPLIKHSFMVAADTEAPLVEHHPFRNTNDLDGPYTICATVTDNIGVEAVCLMYSKNGGMFHRIMMENQGGDLYCAEIPGPSVVGDYYEYDIMAMDESYSGNVTRVPETGYYRFEIVEEFVWDFEDYDGDFVQTGDVWEWGSPTTGPGDAHSGVNVWATVLDGNYPNSADATLDIPAITLSASKPYAMMSFWHYYYIETNYDGGNVKISTDGGMTWDILTPVGGYDGTARSGNAGIPGEPCFTGYNNDFWQQEMFDLSAYAGNTVMIRFHFGSDGSVYRAGWYIDDVRIRSSDVDDAAPTISNTVVPLSTFNTAGPYYVSTEVMDMFSGVASVSLFYSTDDGATFTEVPMTAGAAPLWAGNIPGQPNGTRIDFYVKAWDSAATPNESTDPFGAPGDTYQFSILPSADVLVMQGTSSSTSLDMFREALEAGGYEADYWYNPTAGWLAADKLALYKTVVLDESGSLTSTEQSDLAAFLGSGSPGVKKHLFLLGRDLGYYSSTRPFIEEYMRASYVQDDPAYRELSGEPGEPIGAGETFVISGSYPDEVQRSTTYPGGEIVYRYTGTGSAMLDRGEVEGAYEKEAKEWDGVMPHAPKSLDAAAGIKYNGEDYRSVYFSFNFYYIQESARRAGIIDRVFKWMNAPDIAHVPLNDTEDTLSAYTVVAQVTSSDLDPSRVRLTYDVGAGAVTVTMAATGNPDEYAADIPPQKYGTTVHYYLSAANTDGNTSYHPSNAPADQHTFNVTADNTPPEIVHVPLGNSADLTGPYTVSATITDNVGVDPAGVFLIYNKNGGVNQSIAMTDMGGDLYEADIPGPSSLGDVYNYYISARDIATVPNTARDPVAGFHTFEIVDYYAWDFEGDNGGFTTTGPDWEWGEPTTGPSAAYSGTNVWGTVLGGNYSSSSNSTLDLPPVVVPGSATYAQLSFWQWYYIETNYDGGNVKISTDGGASWTILYPDIGYNGTGRSGNAGIPGEACFTGYNNDEWHKATFDLTAYKGMTVLLRLHFGSDSSVQRVGWYVDDVRVEGVEDTAGPEIVSVDVPGSTFDTTGPYTVTAEVVDALTGVASVDLYYSIDDGSSWTPVSMIPTGTPDEYSGDIPGQASGTRIKLYVQAADNAANTSTDPDGAPATAYEFGIMPSGDYLVILGGASHTPATDYQTAFSAIGRTADVWDWDTEGLPELELLQAYDGVIIDESWYLDTFQQGLLSTFLDADDGSKQQVFFLGRDMSYGSIARDFMEQYTGAAYVKDDPSWRYLRSTPGDPIGNDEVFQIQGSYPDELRLSTTYPGGQVVYKYSEQGSLLDRFDTEQEYIEFYQKEGKDWDPRFWPMVPAGPDTAAAVRYIGDYHASVYFSFQLNYIQDATHRAEILDRVLAWLGTAAAGGFSNHVAENDVTEVPDKLTLGQNIPNPFNPMTRITVGIPRNVDGAVALRIYNVKGQLVKELFSGTRSPGTYTFEWNGMNNRGEPVASGIYFCRFTAGQMKLTRKMILLK